MTRSALWTGFVCLMILAGTMVSEAQRGGGRGGGMRGGGMGRSRPREMPREVQDKMEALRALPLEQIWS
ncbi:MAG: hypothetical protein QGI83_16655, partial [Candidatus Latescibacteria bacterium]|nr:hypothetical protein [Candidatus Latescibacterota bacterium]